MEAVISTFIENEKIASVCYLDAYHHPNCFSCFYAYNKNLNYLIYKSSTNASHSQMKEGNIVSGTILPAKINFASIKGIQFKGVIYNQSKLKNASFIYHKKHPIAMTLKGEIWVIELTHIKYTDNSIGFGKKIVWEKPS